MAIDVDVLDEYFKIKQTVKVAEEEDETSKKSSSADILNIYLAYLRAAYIIHQHSHWKCKCPSFYGNHLLFQRIYESVQELSDEIAEKIIGVFGNDCLKHSEQYKLISNVVADHSSDNYFDNSLEVSNKLLEVIKKAYASIKDNGDMSLGLDDMLMGHASKVEEAVYLLSQAKP